MSKEAPDLVGIGNAIVDVLSMTEDAFLHDNRIVKGAMTLIDAAQADHIYGRMGPAVEVSGGSAANTVAAFALMGGKAAFIGKVAGDQLGSVFRHDLQATGVRFDTPALSDGPPTARCLIMVTPDAQRTMCTFLGASVWISPADLDAALISAAQITYLEGYLFDRDRARDAFRKAGEIAHAAGKKTALTLSDPLCVDRHRDEFLDIVQNHVDIVFANEAEILSLYRTDSLDEAVYNVRQHCAVAALTRSARGSLIVTKDGILEVPAEPVAQIVDTTGAGDLYAAGFLYGYTQGRTLQDCGRMASIAASEVITHIGARPQYSLKALLREKKAV